MTAVHIHGDYASEDVVELLIDLSEADETHQILTPHLREVLKALHNAATVAMYRDQARATLYDCPF